MILLDTHVVVWFFDGDERLGPASRERVESAIGAGAALVSAISFWECAMLVAKGKLELRLPIEKWSRSVLRVRGIRVAPLDADIAMNAGQMPQWIHGDPADRIIMATAQAHRCPVVTGDRKILDYAAAGHLDAIDARV